jgi:D-alanine-D-alanine ligase-like ATP-grasp enzyme
MGKTDLDEEIHRKRFSDARLPPISQLRNLPVTHKPKRHNDASGVKTNVKSILKKEDKA